MQMMAGGYMLMCLIFGTTFLAIKVGLDAGLPPLLMAALRFSAAGALLLAYLAFKRAPFPKDWKVYREISLLGVLMTTAPFAALFWSEQHISSGMASLLVATSPIFIGVFGRMDRKQWLGTALSMIGLTLVVYPDLISGPNTWESHFAKIAIVVSEIAFAYGAVRSKRILSTNIPTLMYNGLQTAAASIVLLVLSLMFESPYSFEWTGLMVGSLLYLSIVASIFASGIYYWLIKMTNPLFPSTWTIVSPIVAIAAGSIVLGESLSYIGAFGAALTLMGIVIVNQKMFLSLKEQMLKGRISATIE